MLKKHLWDFQCNPKFVTIKISFTSAFLFSNLLKKSENSFNLSTMGMWKHRLTQMEKDEEREKLCGSNFLGNEFVKPYKYVNFNFSFRLARHGSHSLFYSFQFTFPTSSLEEKPDRAHESNDKMRAHALNFILIRLKTKRIFMFALSSFSLSRSLLDGSVWIFSLRW